MSFLKDLAEGGVLGAIKGIFEPVAETIDNLHTSDEERLTLKVKFMSAVGAVIEKISEVEGKLIDAQKAIITTEAQGQSWLQRNWRPMVMITFLYIIWWNHIIAPTFGLTALPTPPEMWSLMKIGMGGYIVGRSAEKTVPKILEVLKNNK